MKRATVLAFLLVAGCRAHPGVEVEDGLEVRPIRYYRAAIDVRKSAKSGDAALPEQVARHLDERLRAAGIVSVPSGDRSLADLWLIADVTGLLGALSFPEIDLELVDLRDQRVVGRLVARGRDLDQVLSRIVDFLASED